MYMADSSSTDDTAERLGALIEALPDAISFKDGDGRWVVANSATLRIFRLVDRPWMGKTDLDLADLYPEHAGIYRTCHWDDEVAWDHGTRFDTIEYVPDPDTGAMHTFEVTKVPLFHPDKSRRGLVIIAHDITSRISTEKKLADSELRLRTIIETEPECVKLLAEDGTLLEMNRAGLDMIGADKAEDVVGKPIEPLIMPEYRAAFDDLTKHVFSGESGHLEFEIINLADHHYWLETNAVPLRDASGNIAALLGITRNITERKKVELALQASEQRFRSVMEHNAVGMGIVALDGRFLRVNSALCGITGYTVDELEQLTVGDITHSDDLSSQEKNIQRLINGAETSYTMEKRYRRKDGNTIWVQLTSSVVCDDTDKPLYFIGQVEDITARKQAEIALQESEEKFRSMFELSPEGLALSDLASGQFIEANPALLQDTGYTANEFRTLTCWDVTPPEYTSQERERMEALRTVGHHGPYEKEYIRKNGQRYPVLLRAVRIQDNNGRDLVLSVVQDISERKAAEAEIHRLAYYDPLTNLANRRLLLDRVGKALPTSSRRGTHGAILFIDLDNFKLLNDTMGHDVGDLLLVETAKRLVDTVRVDDTVARLGGDEFVVLLENLSNDTQEAAAQAKMVAEKLRVVLNEPFAFDDHVHQTTPSIGISLFMGTDKTVDDLIKHADVALYSAKNAGRNRVCFYDPMMQQVLETRAELEADLQTALREGQFQLFYQLQMNCGHEVTCAEALIRWDSPRRGLVMPKDFIPLAEETGLIIPIGAWVLETAMRKLKAWEADPVTRNIRVSVNVSSRQFHQPDFVELVRDLIARTGADCTKLKLELTESIVLKDIDDTIKKMKALKGLGIGLAMDDFGTGFSSLSYLVNMPFEQIKIDQSFISHMDATDENMAVVDTIMYLAKNLGLEVVAEGVETEKQYELLSQLGCPSFQGFLFGQPVPEDIFLKMLA